METEQLLKERSSVHGKASNQFSIAQHIKKLFKAQLNIDKFHGYEDYEMAHETLDMIAVKLSRILVGDPNHKDHWDDIAGYAKIYSNYIESKIK